MKISFFGAAQTVTGSKHLIESENYKILLDCGLFQGSHNPAGRNQVLPFNSSEINAVILSHGHLDHCGMIPVLVKSGFKGKIYCTPETAEITRFILEDAAKVQEQEHANPMYSQIDVHMALQQFEPIDYFHKTGQWTELNSRIRFKLYEAGHILGSAMVHLEIKEAGQDQAKTLIFTGDLGNPGAPILKPAEKVQEKNETLILEATYGGKIHKPLETALQDLIRLVTNANERKSKIIVPAFSLERTQEIIYVLHKLLDQKKIPAIQIYIDSPLAVRLQEVFDAFSQDYNKQTAADFTSKREQPFHFKNLIYIHTYEESKQLSRNNGPLMIISASGMSEGGRIIGHLEENLGNPESTIVITGFQEEHTLGRKLQNGDDAVEIEGKRYPVRAKIMTLDEFSAHADQNGLLNFISTVPELKKVYLVHSEPSQADALAEKMHERFPQIECIVPHFEESFEI